MNQPYIVIFDGVCNLCDGSVRFIINRDPTAKFVFTPMQSEHAQTLLKKHNLSELTLDSVVLIKGERSFIQSDAAIEIAKELHGFWRWLRIFKIIPAPIRNFLYQWVAKNRYKIFGRRDVCIAPSPNVRKRFWM
ncbi:thiol-disulfide oxidoreductase DCC family protein [Vibrio makurazakiensis]|uniref:thiol-disulfide oxidoreductase DCC family protein n=1 Tax=Vibrio makurazakiensis TaxID=2910250 RepID=UPI003D0CC31B